VQRATYQPPGGENEALHMFLGRLLRPGPAYEAGQRLYAATVAQARSPAIYLAMGAPDTPDGRFEIYTLHVLLVLSRLKGQGRDASAVSQALFDAYLSGLDHGLRELSVGDLTVGKTMRRLGEAFYGRARALEAALAALPDRGPFNDFIGRTALAGAGADQAWALADYLLAARDALAGQPIEPLVGGELAWPATAG
jgi:cytochrome b pre-mRNA-processing protein 3